MTDDNSLLVYAIQGHICSGEHRDYHLYPKANQVEYFLSIIMITVIIILVNSNKNNNRNTTTSANNNRININIYNNNKIIQITTVKTYKK